MYNAGRNSSTLGLSVQYDTNQNEILEVGKQINSTWDEELTRNRSQTSQNRSHSRCKESPIRDRWNYSTIVETKQEKQLAKAYILAYKQKQINDPVVNRRRQIMSDKNHL